MTKILSDGPWGCYGDSNFHIGIFENDQSLIGFIAAIPSTIIIEKEKVGSAEISFLCVAKKYRGLGLTPILSAEITRRLNRKGICHGIFTATDILYGRVTECQYYHKELNQRKLFDLGVTKKQKFNSWEGVALNSLKRLTSEDLKSARQFVNLRLEDYLISKFFDKREFEWNFLPKHDIVDSFIARDSRSGEITDFCSFYFNKLVGKPVKVSQLMYCLSSVSQENLLISVLALAKESSDIMTCLEMSGIEEYLRKNKFHPGEKTNYYLFNWHYPFIPNRKIAYPVF